MQLTKWAGKVPYLSLLKCSMDCLYEFSNGTLFMEPVLCFNNEKAFLQNQLIEQECNSYREIKACICPIVQQI